MHFTDDPSKRLIQSVNLTQFTKRLRVVEMLSFMSGLVVGGLSLDLNSKQIIQLHEMILNLNNTVNDKIITRQNSIELIVEASCRVKHYRNNSSTLLREFRDCLERSIGQMFGNTTYLINKWSTENKRQKEDQMNEQFIKKLIAQEQQKQRMDIQKNAKLDIECQICITEVQTQDVGSLQCGHIFHRQCINQYIKSEVNQKRLDMKCPMEGCSKLLSISDIKEFIDGDTLEKFDQFCFNTYVEKNSNDTSWCPTPGCSAVFSFDQDLTNYRCSSCTKHYCLKCKAIYHEGMTCAEYRVNNSYGEDDRKFQEFVKGAKYKQCPKCNFWVERVAGCSTMACRCGHEFCYDCGGSDCPHGACKNIGRPVHPIPPPPPIRPYRGGRKR